MLKIHKQIKPTSDPLQRGSNVSLYPPGYNPNFTLNKKNQAAKIEFEKNSKEFDSLKGKQSDPSGQGAPLGLIASGVDSLSKPITQLNSTNDQGKLGIRDAISSTLIQSGEPTMMAIGAVTKTLDMIGDATGVHVDDIDKDAAKKAGIDNAAVIANNAITAIPGMGLLTGIFAQKTNSAKGLTDWGNSVIASYSGTEGDITNAGNLDGKRTLFGRRGINRYIDDVNNRIDVINEIGRTNTLAKRSDYATDIAQQNLNRYAGTNYPIYAVGKNGMKIMSRKELQAILATRKMQNGGVIGTDTNILPEGALHARLNHLQDTNPDLEETTRKGIPVLDENGGQIAEIERDELILRLEITKKIEELMKDGTDEAMIEAGKLLVDEIILNTQDNTGQITEEV